MPSFGVTGGCETLELEKVIEDEVESPNTEIDEEYTQKQVYHSVRPKAGIYSSCKKP